MFAFTRLFFFFFSFPYKERPLNSFFFRCHINFKDVSSFHMGEEAEPYHLFPNKTSPFYSEGHWTNSAMQAKLHT